MIPLTRTRIIAGLLLIALLGACASKPPAPQPKEKVTYIDTNSFDRNLSSSMGANLETIEVPIDDRISPVAIPDRLNKWLAAVDANGGDSRVNERVVLKRRPAP